MLHDVFYSAISIFVNLAFAILPSAPLLAVMRIPYVIHEEYLGSGSGARG
jgi:hypothetical protein